MQKYLLIILCVYSTAAFAAVKCTPKNDDYLCYQKHQRQLAAKLVQAGKKLERIEKQGYLEESTAKLFYLAQKDWQQFVESNCQYESESARKISKAMQYRVQQKCIAQMYDERLNDVNAFIKWATRPIPK